ncbi:uncharacterized protein F5147DRAFT_648325 [Suillus discolor]|uniref:Uncharacterized protein n=1 Tax=Suillus discolor TaxID=1912936 RepID=A0A9P7FJA7_9AGAM|nr:uncharacterized protein F5147DRAFT_648325 [Suillus discolor]KAG2117887.1 hypothetical protein F5147DRAFT_648325 [Suillus discolor]
MAHIIPPTHLKPAESLTLPSAVTFSSSTTRGSYIESDLIMDDDASIAGRHLLETNSALEEGYTALDTVINDTTKNTNMSFYQGTLRATCCQELARLGDSAPPQDGLMTPSTGIHSLQEVGSILDKAAARQGFEAALIMCSNIVNENASLGHVHTMPSAGGISTTYLQTSDHAIIGHMKAHAFKDAKGDNEQASIEVLDISSSEAGEEKDVLKSLKAGLTKQVAELGGKFTDRPFPWILMASSLANDNLCIKGYPAHLSWMPGESHNTNSQSKGVAGLTQHEASVLSHALKVKTMHVVKVTKAIGASKEPVIIGEVPPVDFLFPNVRWMFVNRTFDYDGPACLQPSFATTRKKKPKVLLSSHTQDNGSGTAVKDTMTTIHKTNLHPKVLIPPPPPSCLFKLTKSLPTKPVPAPIEILSSSDDINKPDEEPLELSNGELHSKDDTDYDDFSCLWKRKLNTGGV